MEPSDVWTFEFENEAQAGAAWNAINAKFGAVAELGEGNAKLVIISAPAAIMELAAEIAAQMDGKMKGPSLTWT